MPQTLQTTAEGICPSSAKLPRVDSPTVAVKARISRKGNDPAEATHPSNAAGWGEVSV